MINLLRSLANVSEFPQFNQFTKVMINLLRSLAKVSEFPPYLSQFTIEFTSKKGGDQPP